MPLTEEEKKKIEEEETYRAQVSGASGSRKKGPGCFTILLIIFVGIPLLATFFILAVNPAKNSNDSKQTVVSTPTQIETPTPSQVFNPLVQRFRTTLLDRSKKVIIQGQEIQVGESWDSVVEKLGKTATKTTQDNDEDFGLIIEHQYKDYSILLAREPENLNYFIVWDIYPNDN